jgi:hypothetical protein
MVRANHFNPLVYEINCGILNICGADNRTINGDESQTTPDFR